MNIKNILTALIFLISLSVFSQAKKLKYYTENETQKVLIDFSGNITEIEIINESIIHIRKYKEAFKIKKLPDYVRVLKTQPVTWKVKEEKGKLTITTTKLIVTVNEKGNISYFDKNNKNLLNETANSNHLNNYAVTQSFECKEEGLYGLGQYQSGIMNYKNVPVRLCQYNQEIAVPFLISTKNYGIYWHNYSVTDFNYPENEVVFSKSTAIEKEVEEAVSFTPKETGVYSFFAEISKDGLSGILPNINVVINSDTIIHYSTLHAPAGFSGKKYLEAGKQYNINFRHPKVGGKLLYNTPTFNKTVFSSRHGDDIDYYFIKGDSPETVIANYQDLTGEAPMYAKSVFGFWQCRERYHNQKELLEFANEYRTRKIPVDNIVQDWQYWPTGTKGPEWDRKLYPNPGKMVKELDGLNLKLMVSVWPYVDNKPLLDKYDLSNSKLGEGKQHNLDFYNPKVREGFYRMVSDSMFKIGVTSIWLDGTEPESKPNNDQKTFAGTFEELTNPYSLLVNKAMYEGKMLEYPNKRVFNLTRSGFAGQQRFGATSWSGDIGGTWEQFREQIPAGLNFVMTGIPYWSHDIGGFFRDQKSKNAVYDSQYTNPEYIELLTRWFQYGAFNPIFRIHGYKSNTEVWNYGKEFETTARKFIDLRYQLLPYIYSESRKVTTESKLLMSPLVYQYPNDKKVWEIKDQFLFGSSLLVCPVTTYKARSRKVYLPEGEWYNYFTNKKFKGSQIIDAEAALDELPLYVKAGSIIPMGPKIQYATQPTEEPLHIKVFPGKDSEFVLYLDDNESNNYVKGDFSEIVFNYNDAEKTLTIKKGHEQFIDFNKTQQKLIVELIGSDSYKNVVFNGSTIKVNFKN